MVSIDNSVVAKLKKGSKTYEILVDSQGAHDFKKGKSVSLSEVLVTDEIFYDAKKGIRASEHELMEIFGTDDHEEICSIIIKEGNTPVTADMKREELEIKKRQIINLIHKNVVDPNSGKPHPPQRIETAMNEAKVRIDEKKSAEEQMNDVINQLRRIIPIKSEIREVNVKIPSQYAGRLQGIIRKYGRVLREDWGSDSLLVNME